MIFMFVLGGLALLVALGFGLDVGQTLIDRASSTIQSLR